MNKSFPRLLPSLIFAILLFFSPGWNEVSGYATDAETQSMILYVKPGANGTCSSWADACELQTALFNAVAGDQIWVAAGTYKPTTLANRTISFQLKSSVAVYGGFPASGGEMAERDWETNITTLSGDIGTVGDNSDNSFHVVIGSAVGGTSILDGFTITGGNANGTTLNAEGGGMYISNGSPTLTNLSIAGNTAVTSGGGLYNNASDTTLTNVTFTNNTAAKGGGIYNRISNPTLINVTFSTNSASVSGGGMMNSDSSNPTLNNVNFVGNSAVGDANYQGGGGMANFGSNPTLTNVTFTSNTVMSGGGGGLFNNSSSPIMTEITFNGNSSISGGGMCNTYHSSPILTEVTFLENTASFQGGGLANLSQSNPLIESATFTANEALTGGGLSNYYASPSLINVTFSENLADRGGGLYNIYDSNPTLTNVTFSGNSARVSGGGIHSQDTSPFVTQVSNSIFWGNTPEQIAGDSATITYSDIQGGYPGDGNISINPLLGALADNGGITKTHALNTGSPAIDAANSETCPTFDQRYYVRPIDGDGDGSAICDMGAYEYGSTEDGFTLVTTMVGSGTVTVDPQKTGYRYGEEVTLTATAVPGWTFSGWGGDASGTDNPLTYTIVGNTTITASFTQDEYTLTVTPVGSGTVDVSPVQDTYHYGDVVTLTPSAIPGWSFSSWSGDASGNENPLTFTIVGNTDITVHFTQDEYTLAVLVNPEGKGSVSITPFQSTYHYGDVVTLTASSNPGWTFSSWSGDATGTNNPLSYIVLGDISITANFTQDEYTLTITHVGSGTVAVDPVQATYQYGDVVTLTPAADPSWTFLEWSGDATGSDNPLTYTIVGDTNITATFTQDEYTLTVTPTGSGTVAIDPVQATYHYGDIVTLTPTADPGWTFAGWDGAASGSENPLAYTIVGNTTIIATFTQDEYTLTVTPTGSGTVAIDPVQATYHYGDIVTLTPTSDPGWTFSEWGGDASGLDNPLTITIQGNTTITATFTQDVYALTVIPIGSGMVTVDPIQATYHYGDVVTLTPTADVGWTFDGWGGDASGSDNPLSYTIIEDATIMATFTQDEYTLAVTIAPAGTGTVIISPMQTSYHYGDEVTLTPVANPGWTFLEWSGDVSGSDNPLTLTIHGDTNITANFTQDQYTLDVTIEGFGSVAIDPVQATYIYGTEITLTATADPSWVFAGWGGDASGSDNPLTLTIHGDTNITALFTTNWIFLPMITR